MLGFLVSVYVLMMSLAEDFLFGGFFHVTGGSAKLELPLFF
jgi:hypothetical protein